MMMSFHKNYHLEIQLKEDSQGFIKKEQKMMKTKKNSKNNSIKFNSQEKSIFMIGKPLIMHNKVL